jgi:hypothetical protein
LAFGEAGKRFSRSCGGVFKPSDGFSKPRRSFSRTSHWLLQRPNKRDGRMYKNDN